MNSDARSNLQRDVDRLADMVLDLTQRLDTLHDAYRTQAHEILSLRLRVQHLENGRSFTLEQLGRQWGR